MEFCCHTELELYSSFCCSFLSILTSLSVASKSTGVELCGRFVNSIACTGTSWVQGGLTWALSKNAWAYARACPPLATPLQLTACNGHIQVRLYSTYSMGGVAALKGHDILNFNYPNLHSYSFNAAMDSGKILSYKSHYAMLNKQNSYTV